MEAYKIGLSALKKSITDSPLSEEKVQDTMIELEDVLEQHRDIENALSQTITSGGEEATDSDLEDELKDILAAEAAAEEEAEEAELVLPSAPTESPKRRDEEGTSSKSLRLPAQR